jgi:AcrR family transcriptional regulator
VVEAIVPLDPDDLEARAHAGTQAYFRVMTHDRRWARIALVESVGVSQAAEEHRRAAIARFADLICAELTQLGDSGLIPKRDYALTAVAIVGAINGLASTWTAEEWQSRVDDVAAESARMIVAAARYAG